MSQPILVALLVFGLSFMGLLAVEMLIHKLRHNPDKNYRWGVWLFSILAAVYAYITSLGRV